MMKVKLCDENGDAGDLLPPNQPDGSGIGVNYVDACLKPLNTNAESGEKVVCKRKGLKVMFSYGDQQGDALLCKRSGAKDPREILASALGNAANMAGVSLAVEDGAVFLETEA